jgi:inhibitor of KinA
LQLFVAEPAYPSIFPLGDSAVTLDLGNYIDEQHNALAVAIQDWLEIHRFPGVEDILTAYSSVSVHYNPSLAGAAWPRNQAGEGPFPREGIYPRVRMLLEQAWREVTGEGTFWPNVHEGNGRSFRIPVCYEREYAPDLSWVAAGLGLTAEEVIGIHATPVYRVYMIGFLPGFPYLGRLDERLQVPRKPQPVNVTAGGVGIAGVQTGIYPLTSPGGWHIIGRTPVKLFNPDADPPVRLLSGDYVQFYPVSLSEFRQLSARPA